MALAFIGVLLSVFISYFQCFAGEFIIRLLEDIATPDRIHKVKVYKDDNSVQLANTVEIMRVGLSKSFLLSLMLLKNFFFNFDCSIRFSQYGTYTILMPSAFSSVNPVPTFTS